MNVATQTEIVALVQRFLDQHQPPSYALKVDEVGIRQEDDWWFVTVKPDRNGVRAHDYAERLTEAEDEIQRETRLNILLVPVLVDD